jgi:hypothetical protein
MPETGRIENFFEVKGLPSIDYQDAYKIRVSVHDERAKTGSSVCFEPKEVTGRLLVTEEDPKRIVVIATEQFSISGSPTSLMALSALIDSAVASMLGAFLMGKLAE